MNRREFAAALGLLLLVPLRRRRRVPTLPTLPTTFSVPYSLPTGTTRVVAIGANSLASGTNFQAAIDASSPGDVIVLTAGVEYEGNFKLPIKAGTSWIYIVSNMLGSLPREGVRATSSHATFMPKIVGHRSVANRPGMATFKSAHNYRFVGCEFMFDTNFGDQVNLIQTGYGSGLYSDPSYTWSAVTSSADLPDYIVMDRCYVHSKQSNYGKKARCGFMMNGTHMACIDSSIEGFWDSADAQAINIYNGGQYYKIVNNYLEATGENFMSGGTDPTVGNISPLDIEFVGNYLYKNPASGTIGVIKNLFELKNAERVLCEGNVMDNVFEDNAGQKATGLVLTVRNQSGTNTNAHVRDVTIRYNKISHFSVGFRITGLDDLQTSQQNQRILLEHNSFDYSQSPAAPTFGYISSVAPDGALDITIRHNLYLNHGNGNGTTEMLFLTAPLISGSTYNEAVENLTFENNIICLNRYGLIGNVVGSGQIALTKYAIGTTVYEKNVHINRSVDTDFAAWETNFASAYPANNFKATEFSGVGFQNFNNGNYSLAVGSTYKNAGNDGTDPGPNWTLLNSKTENTLSGITSSDTASITASASRAGYGYAPQRTN